MPRVPEEQLHLRFAHSSFSSEESLQEGTDSPKAKQTGATILAFPQRHNADAKTTDEQTSRFALIQKVLDRVSKF